MFSNTNEIMLVFKNLSSELRKLKCVIPIYRNELSLETTLVQCFI